MAATDYRDKCLFQFPSAPATDVTSGTWVSATKEPQQEQEHVRRNCLRSERNRGSPRSLNKCKNPQKTEMREVKVLKAKQTNLKIYFSSAKDYYRYEVLPQKRSCHAVE